MAPVADAGRRPPCVPSLKFVGLAVRKIWCTMCVCINGPGDLELTLLTLKLVCKLYQKGEPSFRILARYVFEFSSYSSTLRTDERTDKSNAYCPLPYGRGIIIALRYSNSRQIAPPTDRHTTDNNGTCSNLVAYRLVGRYLFLPRGAMHKRRLCRHAMSVRLSDCLSVRHVREFCQNE